jgi:ABC-type antimicrobial peptide transport system permease subunit
MTLYARFRATLLTLFSLGSLLLGGVGVYGVASQTVVRRVPELGLRKAIGAGSGDLVWLVLRQGGVAAIVGLCLGAGTALAGAGVLSRFLYGVVPRSPQILFLVAAVLLAATMVAMLGPAIRAARVDPMTALRQE